MNMFYLLYFIFYPLYILITTLLVLIVVIFVCVKLYSEATKGKCKSKARLDGKVALITGGSSGIGLETARDFARRGAKVVIASRDAEKAAKAIEYIIVTTGNKNVEYKHLDLSKFSSVRTFAEDFNNKFDRLDILVNNSGCGRFKQRLTEDGINVVNQVNYFGPFLLTNLLLDKVIASKPSRIIIVSSGAHLYAKLDLEDLKGEAVRWWYTIYANSKLCNNFWAKALAKNVPEGVTVNVLHPGIVQTDIFNRFDPITNKIVGFLVGNMFKTAEEGAQTTIHVAVDEGLNNVTGKYFVDCKISDENELVNDADLVSKVWYESLLITN